MVHFFFQIVFESLPVSSSGHVWLFSYLMSYCTMGLFCVMSQSVDFLLHGPALLLYAIFFFDRWRLILSIPYLKRHYRYLMKLLFFVCCADLVTGLGYLGRKALGISFDSSNLPWPPIAGFVLTIIVLVMLDMYENRVTKVTKGALSLKNSLLLGAVQLGALFLPGLSRLAITYATLRFCGFTRRKGFELSILVQIPLIIIAFIKGAMQSPWLIWLGEGTNTVVYVTTIIVLSSMISYLCLRLTYHLALQGRLIYFAYYLFGLIFSTLCFMLVCCCF